MTLVAAAWLATVSGCGGSARPATAGFWYADGPLALTPDAARRLGGSLTGSELDEVKKVSRDEVERAFSGLNVQITDNPRSFWRVEVLQALRTGRMLPNVGESMPLGMLGGLGSVAFDLVASKAIQYAPAGAARPTIVEGIGRGIGRVAAHELAHQILNADAVHNKDDENSYEYPSPDRTAQYYGELHWTTAQPLLEQKLR